jgi:hypothetical protein
VMFLPASIDYTIYKSMATRAGNEVVGTF